MSSPGNAGVKRRAAERSGADDVALEDRDDVRRAEPDGIRVLVGVSFLGRTLSGDASLVVLHFTVDLARLPPHWPGHEVRGLLGSGQAAVPGLDRDVRAACQHVVQVPR